MDVEGQNENYDIQLKTLKPPPPPKKKKQNKKSNKKILANLGIQFYCCSRRE